MTVWLRRTRRHQSLSGSCPSYLMLRCLRAGTEKSEEILERLSFCCSRRRDRCIRLWQKFVGQAGGDLRTGSCAQACGLLLFGIHHTRERAD